MKRRFVIASQGLTPQEELTLANFLQGKADGTYWHWIDNVWLFITTDEDITTAAINDYLGELNSAARNLVIEFPQHIKWSGRGPRTEKSNMFSWLHNAWKKVP